MIEHKNKDTIDRDKVELENLKRQRDENANKIVIETERLSDQIDMWKERFNE